MATILLIEDEECIRDIFDSILKIDGHRVEGYATIDEGVSAYLNNSYDLVISDWSLPDGSGLRVAEKIRENETNPSLIITTGQDKYIIGETLDGINGLHYEILSKPFDIPALLDMVTRFL